MPMNVCLYIAWEFDAVLYMLWDQHPESRILSWIGAASWSEHVLAAAIECIKLSTDQAGAWLACKFTCSDASPGRAGSMALCSEPILLLPCALPTSSDRTAASAVGGCIVHA
jgi:hypothetical protein